MTGSNGFEPIDSGVSYHGFPEIFEPTQQLCPKNNPSAKQKHADLASHCLGVVSVSPGPWAKFHPTLEEVILTNLDKKTREKFKTKLN